MSSDLDALWRFVLQRPIEPDELPVAEGRLGAGMGFLALLQELATSPEFEHLKRLEDAVSWAGAQRRAGQRPRNIEAPADVDERPVEIAWCLARVAPEERVLDVGFAFGERAYLAALGELGDVTGVDLVPARVPGVK